MNGVPSPCALTGHTPRMIKVVERWFELVTVYGVAYSLTHEKQLYVCVRCKYRWVEEFTFWTQ